MTKDTTFSNQSPILATFLKLPPLISHHGGFLEWSLLIKFLVNDQWTHGLISTFAILSKKLRCIWFRWINFTCNASVNYRDFKIKHLL